MGIDIYARWKGQTEAEENAQYAGFSITAGSVGYLREAYHGSPYATAFLCQEAFASPTAEAAIPAAVLRERLPRTLELARERQLDVYAETDEEEIAMVLQSFMDFVFLCEDKEAETGEPVRIIASY
jgi:hypothetical protein